jgi:hypothetical protein
MDVLVFVFILRSMMYADVCGAFGCIQMREADQLV